MPPQLEKNHVVPTAWQDEDVKAVYCHPAYLAYMQSTLCEMMAWMNHKAQRFS